MLNLHRYNYPWSEYTIGVFGNLLLLATGLLCAASFRAPKSFLKPNTLGAGLPLASIPALNPFH